MITITHIPDTNRQDGGGSMEVKATTPKDKLEVFKHFKLEDTKKLAGRAALRVLQPAGTKDNSGWFDVVGGVPDNFIAPYLKLLEKRTGYNKGLPTIDTRTMIKNYGVLHYTHYVRRLLSEDGKLRYHFVVNSKDWDGCQACKRAATWANESILGALGVTKIEPEFIEHGGGLFSRNRNYTKRHNPVPGLTAHWFYHALADWWVSNCATAGQVRLVKRSADIMKRNHNGVSDLHCMRDKYGLIHAWSKPVVTWEEFKNLV